MEYLFWYKCIIIINILINQISAAMVGIHLVPVAAPLVPRPVGNQAQQHKTPATLHVWHLRLRFWTAAVLRAILLWGRLEISVAG